MFKHGAMFGLDARIALVIFGALSVISGAALYNAIQDAKVTAIITEMNEVAKSYEAYYLDTGTDLVLSSTLGLDIGELVEDTKNLQGWKGPYTSLAKTSSASLKSVYSEGNVHIYLKDSAVVWGGAVGDSSAQACDAGEVCETWVRFDRVAYNLMPALDIKVDGIDDADAGKFRYVQRTDDTSQGRAFLRIANQFK
ncbi:MAG: hypothetical protein CFH44_00639 [Proteobacteria bacterium]|nr:MAG: hypothetical protein CFH44_00639 [Pseudomonadota bacterium]